MRIARSALRKIVTRHKSLGCCRVWLLPSPRQFPARWAILAGQQQQEAGSENDKRNSSLPCDVIASATPEMQSPPCAGAAYASMAYPGIQPQHGTNSFFPFPIPFSPSVLSLLFAALFGPDGRLSKSCKLAAGPSQGWKTLGF